MNQTGDYIWKPWRLTASTTPPEIVTYNASMTRRLAADSNETPLILKRREKITRAHSRDCLLLSQHPKSWLWQREILLGNQQPWLYGYTLTLPSCRSATLWDLHHIGSKPLGEKLFTTKNVQRVLFEVGEIPKSHYLWNKVQQLQADIPELLWARCSLFSYQKNALLLYEILLPECPGIKNHE